MVIRERKKGLITWIWTVVKRLIKVAEPPRLESSLNQIRDQRKPSKRPVLAISTKVPQKERKSSVLVKDHINRRRFPGPLKERGKLLMTLPRKAIWFIMREPNPINNRPGAP
jgi:hypothetical protein